MTIFADTIKPWHLFRERDYSLLLLGQFISALGDKLHYIALGVIVYQKTGSALEVGKITLATFLPYLLFGLVAGAYVDRWNKKATMIAADLLRVLLVALIPFLLQTSLSFVYILTFLITTANLFFSPAKMSVIPSIFPKENILSAISLAESVESVTEVIGYALAGFITVLLPIYTVFYLDALTFFISALSIYAMNFSLENSTSSSVVNLDTDEGATPHIFQEITDGIVYVFKNKLLSSTLLTYSLAVFLFSGFNPLVFVYALNALGTTPVGLGFLESAAAIGMTAGGLAIGLWGSRLSKQALMFGGYLISGITIALLGLFPWYPLALVGFFFTGVSNMMFLLPVQSLFQEETRPEMRGRVFSARFAITRAAYLGSVAVLSWTATRLNVQNAYIISGLALTLLSLSLLVSQSKGIYLSKQDESL